MSNPKLYLVDASGLCYRAYYALGNLSTSYGQPTGAVFGFTNILNKLLKEQRIEYLACCWDVSRDTFRKKKFTQYKIHRQPMPDNLISQMSLIRQAISAYNVPVYEKEGYEADDIIATLSKKAAAGGIKVVVVSSDKDLLQLVSENIALFDPQKGFYDIQAVLQKFGITPAQIADMISLMGDPVDNIPGVKGVGEKTAVSLISRFGNINALFENLQEIKSENLRNAINENIENIKMSYELALLKDDVDIPFDIESLRLKSPDYDRLYALFRKLEFKSLLKNLPLKKDKQKKEEISFFSDEAQRKKAFAQIRAEKEIVIAVDNIENKINFSVPSKKYSCDVESLKEILEDPGIKKIGYNLKEQKMALRHSGIELNGIYFDVMLASYAADSSVKPFGLQELAFSCLDKRLPEDLAPQDVLGIVDKLYAVLKEKITKDSLEGLFYDLDMPLVNVLAAMELNGVLVDRDKLAVISDDLDKRLIQLRKEIYALNFGQEFNLNSPRQLSTVLFERLKLPIIKKGKTGPSTDEEVLNTLAQKHKLPSLLLEYRQLTKLKGTYVDSLPALINSQTGRIHAVFDQAGTETGRLSSNNPNLQNIPVRGEIAGLIRKSFIASEDNLIISSDYSQIELRVLAHFSKDKALITAFQDGLDIHRHTAGLIFQVKEDEVTGPMRETAKRINFGIIYGMSNFGLSKDLKISTNEAQAFIDEYFLRYPGVKSYIDGQIKLAKSLGYVTTLLGRRRYLPAINSPNKALISFAERQAVNSPIQGSAADIIKLAMINIDRALNEKKMQSMMIMQIHDELVFEAPEDEFEQLVEIIKNKMEGSLELSVPLKVNIKKGKSWGEEQDVI